MILGNHKTQPNVVCQIVWLRDGNVYIYNFDDMEVAKWFEYHLHENSENYQIFNGTVEYVGVEETIQDAFHHFGNLWMMTNEDREKELNDQEENEK